MSKPHLATAEAQHEGSKEMQCTSKNYSVQTPNIDQNCFKTVIRGGGSKKALQNDVSTTWFGTAGREVIFMSKPHMATAEAQHEGSKEMQCTSKNYSVQTPNID